MKQEMEVNIVPSEPDPGVKFQGLFDSGCSGTRLKLGYTRNWGDNVIDHFREIIEAG